MKQPTRHVLNFLICLSPWLLSPLLSTASETTSKTPLTAQSPQEIGPHGGKVVNQKGKRFEIKLDEKNNHVDIYSPDSTSVRPENMSITLYNDDKTGQKVKLKAVPPTPDGFNHYEGRLSITEAPFISFGLQFDLSPKPESKQPPKEEQE